MIYPVKDSHSSLGTYNHKDHAWSNDQHDNSDEVKWVDITKTLHPNTLEHMDLIDGRTGTPSTPALYQRRRHSPFLNFSQIYKVKDSNSYISPYEQREHSWSDKQYDVADEEAWLGTTKTLNEDYLENLQPTAEYHLVGGRTGVPEEDDE